MVDTYVTDCEGLLKSTAYFSVAYLINVNSIQRPGGNSLSPSSKGYKIYKFIYWPSPYYYNK